MGHICHSFGGCYQLNGLYRFKAKCWIIVLKNGEHVRKLVANIKSRRRHVVFVEGYIYGTMHRIVCRFFRNIQDINRSCYDYYVFGLVGSYKVPRTVLPQIHECVEESIVIVDARDI
jgi:hypothetical protein